jgi:hypothetical protein
MTSLVSPQTLPPYSWRPNPLRIPAAPCPPANATGEEGEEGAATPQPRNRVVGRGDGKREELVHPLLRRRPNGGNNTGRFLSTNTGTETQTLK